MANVTVEKTPALGLPDPLCEKIGKMTEEIRRRAYSLFEGRGWADGHDVDDWLEAERQVVWSPTSELIDSQEKFAARMALPGFDAKEIRVTATPYCLVVHAGHPHDNKDGRVHRGQTLFRRLELPAEIDLDKITASLEKGVLQITAPKATVKRLQVAA